MKIKLKPLSQCVLQALMWTALGILPVSIAHAHNSLSADEIDEVKVAGLSSNPLSIPSLNVPTLVMLAVGRDHNLFTEAYSDYTDLTGDNVIDYMFDPSFNYYGLFDTNLCYEYTKKFDGVTNMNSKDNIEGFWIPTAIATNKTANWTVGTLAKGGTVKVCPGSGKWSGNFLNYATSSRIDVIRKVLYGGTRVTSTAKPKDVTSATSTAYYAYSSDSQNYKAVLLKHSNVLRDAHSWGKVFAPRMYQNQFTYDDFIGEKSVVGNDGAVFIGLASYDDPQSYDADNDSNLETQFNKDRSSYMRVAWVNNAGVPGEASANNSGKTFIWDWVSQQGSKNLDKGSFEATNTAFAKDATSYDVLVVSCMKVGDYINLEECKDYTLSNTSNPGWRPYGILQEYNGGENPSMQFGLITGSWSHNVVKSSGSSGASGAALRANIGNYSAEFDDKTGDFKYKGVSCSQGSVCGFVSTLDAFRIRGKVNGSDVNYEDCRSWRTDYTADMLKNGIPQGKCKDWGNPVSRLLLAAGQYFSNDIRSAATYGDTPELGVGTLNFADPYPRRGSSSTTAKTMPYCARPVSILMADESISYDTSDPGNANADYGVGIDSKYVDWELVDKGFKSGNYFVGHSASAKSEDHSEADYYKFIPSMKYVGSLKDVVGLAPSVAFAYGGYNVAAIAAKFSHADDVIEVADKENKKVFHKMETYVVAMKPNMPEIKVNIGNGQNVSIVPFAVTPAYSVSKNPQEDVRSINQVADFYVESLSDTEGVFRINYEDFQFGSDYDMDWIVEYRYKVLTGANNQKYIRIQVSNVESDHYSNQHAGYVITGVESSGVYVDLEKPEITESPFEVSDDHPYKYHIKIDTPITDLTISTCYNDLSDSDISLSDTAILNCFKSDNTAKKGTDFLNKYQWVDSHVDTQYKRIEATNGLYYQDKYTIATTKGLSCTNGNTNKTTNGMTICNDLSYRNLGHHWRVDKLDGVTASSRLFKVNGSSDGWLKSPLWYAARNGLRDTDSSTAGEPSNYFLATDPSKIKTGLKNILDQIGKSTHSGMGFSTESKTTQEGDFAYGTQYDPSTWWGDVLKGQIGSTGGYESTHEATGVTRIQTIKWSAAEQFEATPIANRLIFTVDHDDLGAPYKRIYSEITTNSKGGTTGALGYLGENVFKRMLPESARATFDASDADDVNQDAYLFMNRFTRWLVGEHAFEGVKSATSADKDLALNGASPLRERINMDNTGTHYFVLGDVIDSDAVAFTIDSIKFIVVGSNDGMLHFLDAETGKPILSYMPTAFLEEMHELADPSYNRAMHRYRLNATPVVTTFDSKTYVYGTFGLGYPGAYALDVTGLRNFIGDSLTGAARFSKLGNDVKLLWEALDSAHGGSDYVGKMREAPTHIDVDDTRNNTAPYLVFTSGYEAVKPGFFIVALDPSYVGSCASSASGKKACMVTSGDVVASDPLNIGRQNGLATPSVAKQDMFSKHYNAIYFGDLFGNVWKIDLDADTSGALQNNIADWGRTTETKPKVLFTAKDNQGDVQSITGRIGLSFIDSHFTLVFGTGQFIYTTDNKEISTKYNTYQSVYILRDGTGLGTRADQICNASITRDCVRKADIVIERDESGAIITDAPRRYTAIMQEGDLGWYLNLTDRNNTTHTGERVYTNPLIIGSRAYITTNTPNVGDECLGAGTSNLLSIDLTQLQATTVGSYGSLAGSPVATLHDGKVIIHVPVDAVSGSNSSGGTPEEYNYEDLRPTVRGSSVIKLY